MAAAVRFRASSLVCNSQLHHPLSHQGLRVVKLDKSRTRSVEGYNTLQQRSPAFRALRAAQRRGSGTSSSNKWAAHDATRGRSSPPHHRSALSACRSDAASSSDEELQRLADHYLQLAVDDAGLFHVTIVPGIMTRVTLVAVENRELRFHLFYQCESYVHDHSYDFASLCLFGAYWETLYAIEHAGEGGHHYASIRSKGGKLREPERLPGSLVELRGGTVHRVGNVLRRASDTHHKTQSMDDDASQQAWCRFRGPSSCLFSTVTLIQILRPTGVVKPTTILASSQTVSAPHQPIREPTEQELAQTSDMLLFLHRNWRGGTSTTNANCGTT